MTAGDFRDSGDAAATASTSEFQAIDLMVGVGETRLMASDYLF